MTFLEQCIQDSMPIWQDCLESEFVQGVAHGTLPEECFKGYIVDDSLYLREYSKVFAWGILHSHDMEEIRNYYSLLSFVNESEDATRRYYLKHYHLTDEAPMDSRCWTANNVQSLSANMLMVHSPSMTNISTISLLTKNSKFLIIHYSYMFVTAQTAKNWNGFELSTLQVKN